MEDAGDIEQDAFGTNVSCCRLPTEDGRGAAIHPFAYMSKTSNPDLAAAVVRFVEALYMAAVEELLDSIPAEAYGTVLTADAVRESHKVLLRYRLEHGMLPVCRRIIG